MRSWPTTCGRVVKRGRVSRPDQRTRVRLAPVVMDAALTGRRGRFPRRGCTDEHLQLVDSKARAKEEENCEVGAARKVGPGEVTHYPIRLSRHTSSDRYRRAGRSPTGPPDNGALPYAQGADAFTKQPPCQSVRIASSRYVATIYEKTDRVRCRSRSLASGNLSLPIVRGWVTLKRWGGWGL